MKRITLLALGVLFVASAADAAIPADSSDRLVTRLVGWKAGAVDSLRATILSDLGARVTGRVPLIRMERVELAANEVANLRGNPAVAWVERDRQFHLLDEPNDPYLPYQWSLYRTGVVKAWEKETGTRWPVTVAVVDGGVESVHPDLIGRIIRGYDYVSLDDDPGDPNGHGTHVAGIIAATQDNNLGIAGMSWGAKVLAI
ncbi:MAG: S8 family serine peptidase, partial [Actinomycetota bacterium]